MIDFNNTQRIVQEPVPGKQITLAHVIASPAKEVYERAELGQSGAIGILALTPYETAIIAADIAVKSANVSIGALDIFTGSVLLFGDVNSVTTSLEQVCIVLEKMLGFTATKVTKS